MKLDIELPATSVLPSSVPRGQVGEAVNISYNSSPAVLGGGGTSGGGTSGGGGGYRANFSSNPTQDDGVGMQGVAGVGVEGVGGGARNRGRAGSSEGLGVYRAGRTPPVRSSHNSSMVRLAVDTRYFFTY